MMPVFFMYSKSAIFLLLDSGEVAGEVADSFSTGFQDGGSIWGAVLMLVVMIAVVVGAYFVTRFIVSGMMGGSMRGSRMKIVDRLILSRDKAILIVKIADMYYAVGVAGNSVSLICELPPGLYDEEADNPSAPRSGTNWKEVLNRSINTPPKREPPQRPMSSGNPKPRGRRVSEDELSEMAERMRMRSQTLSNREDGHDEN